MISRRSQALLLVLVGCATLLVLGLWKTLSVSPSLSQTSSVGQPTEASTRALALTVLSAWDERRATAYAAGDVDALARLYLPGSESGENDRRVLGQYLARGLLVQEMHTQILDLEIQDHDQNRLSLRVTDRLSSAIATGAGIRVRLPRDQATTRQIELRRVGSHWLVDEAEVSDQPAVDRSSAEESTSTTPVSRKP